MRRKFNGAVKPDGRWVNVFAMAFDSHEIEIWKARRSARLPPDFRSPRRLWKEHGSVNKEQRPTIDFDVPIVGKSRNQMLDVGLIILRRILLLQKNVGVHAIPASRPVLVGPAEAKGQLRGAGAKHLIEGPIQQAPPVEPIVVVAESRDAVRLGQFRLRLPSFGNAQVIEPEIRRQMRLIMSLEEWLRPDDISPFSKPFAPPLVVLRDRVILRQVERNKSVPCYRRRSSRRFLLCFMTATFS